ncbi:hypothetical protein B9Z55_022749 [Caenorhabditis nigoni]|uniref:Uncharacterized protein n=1 Tax=Caenorhabditis nigoni TaxID=1611254 RepID=A0A2G5SLH7_9PELO|nr:hypothetical protein B9Z55_022749 [Caenorhabditis nigoni]
MCSLEIQNPISKISKSLTITLDRIKIPNSKLNLNNLAIFRRHVFSQNSKSNLENLKKPHYYSRRHVFSQNSKSNLENLKKPHYYSRRHVFSQNSKSNLENLEKPHYYCVMCSLKIQNPILKISKSLTITLGVMCSLEIQNPILKISKSLTITLGSSSS